MNKTLITILIVLAILVLSGMIFFAGSLYGRMNLFGPSAMFHRSMMARWQNLGSSFYGGMHGNGGMMGGYGYSPESLPRLTVDQVKASAGKYLEKVKNPDLRLTEVMIFDNNAYVVVKENSTGIGAFELLVDPVSLTAYPEHGPNMMWNLKYGGLNRKYMMGNGGMMKHYGGSMMGGWSSANPGDVPAAMAITAEQAVQQAQDYLDANLPGAKAADDPTQFYGYYTLDFTKDGQVAGMLSVNGTSGQVFLHTWHGTFIEEKKNL